MHTIQYDNSDIVIRFSRAAINSQSLERLLEWLDLEEIRQKSQLTNEQIDDLTQTIKQTVWKELQHYVL